MTTRTSKTRTPKARTSTTRTSTTRTAKVGRRATGDDQRILTALSPETRDPNLIGVAIDGRSVGVALRSLLEPLRLRVGARLSASHYAAVQAACRRAEVRAAALAALGRRDLPRLLLERLLRERKGFDEVAVAATIAELDRDGWLDDKRYAANRARALVAQRGCAHTFVVETLEAEGVDPRVANRVAREEAPAASDLERALALGRDALKKSLPQAPRGGRRGSTPTGRLSGALATARRIGQLLARRGFDADTIGTVLERLGLGTDE